MVVRGAHQSCHRDEEKEDSHSNDSSNDVNARHHTEALAPGSHANEQKAHKHINHVESAQRIPGTGKSAANHLPRSGDPNGPKTCGEGIEDRLVGLIQFFVM